MKKTAFPNFIEINLMKYEDNGNKIYILLILYLLYIIKNNRIKNIINDVNNAILFNNAQIDILMILMHYI